MGDEGCSQIVPVVCVQHWAEFALTIALVYYFLCIVIHCPSLYIFVGMVFGQKPKELKQRSTSPHVCHRIVFLSPNLASIVRQ